MGKGLEFLKTNKKQMEIKYLEVLVMPNNEVLYMGRTLGFISESSLTRKDYIREEDLKVLEMGKLD